MVVFVVESGSYEQRSIDFVAATRQGAIDRIKAMHGPEYPVIWHESEGGLTGEFTRRVEGLCCAGNSDYDITEYEVSDNPERVEA